MLFDNDEALSDWLATGELATIFAVIYGACILFIFIVSLAGPIDRAMFYFKTSAVFFTISTLSTVVGIAALELDTGLKPQMEIYDTESKAWYPCYEAPVQGEEPVPIRHFHILLVSTFIMLAVYATPMLIRPIDFV